MQPHDQLNIESESSEGGKESEALQDSEDTMEPDHTEREVLLPSQSRSSKGLMYKEPRDRYCKLL